MKETRGQAFTLEGLTAGLVLVTAVLFAVQSVAVTPTTGGAIDERVQSDTRAEAKDILTSVAANESFGLSELVRYWSPDALTFQGAINTRIGYGDRRPPGELGVLLEEVFTARGETYNIEVEYQRKNISNGTRSITMVYRGEPSDDAVTVSQVVTLYDNQTLTAPSSSRARLRQYDTNATNSEASYYPIPNAVNGTVYNVVKVRVTVW
ncbi:DUF7288 family protein [Halorientalis pallida]|uniref:DUF7288 family protein n=1 Tax=Halorientalis pallida TaxID=2479928 RepID=UPI003C6F7C1A